MRLRSRSGGRNGAGYRIFFATDVHGSERCFRKFLAAAEVYSADSLILGGDVGGKAIVPIQETEPGSFSFNLHGDRRNLDEPELELAMTELRDAGMYPRICTADEMKRLGSDEPYREQEFRQEICEQLARWCELAGERLGSDTSCVITPGNDDPLEIDAVLERSAAVACPEEALMSLGPVVLASLGTTTPTPWSTERECSEDELRVKIERMLANAPRDTPLVFNFHCPPYASGLDTVATLDESFKPVVRNGHIVEGHAGSHAVHDSIAQYAPVVALHGHVHEAPGICRIGRSVCINPGSDYSSGVLKGAIVQLDARGKFRDYLLTTG